MKINMFEGARRIALLVAAYGLLVGSRLQSLLSPIAKK